MQVYYMHRDGISPGSSTLTLLINLSLYLFVLVTLSLFNLIFNYQYMSTGLALFFILGTLVNVCGFLLFMVAVFSEKTLNKVIGFVNKVIQRHYEKKIARIKKLNLKNTEQLIDKANKKCERRIQKVNEQAAKYRENAIMVRQNKKVIIKSLIVFYIEYIVFYSVSYFAYRAVGLNDHSWFEVTSLQSIVYATVSGIPSPGSVGVSEAAYIGLFKNIIPENLIGSVMLLVRLLTFYLFVVIEGIVVIINAVTTKRREVN